MWLSTVFFFNKIYIRNGQLTLELTTKMQHQLCIQAIRICINNSSCFKTLKVEINRFFSHYFTEKIVIVIKKILY